jgi:hypothetical protein
MRIYKIIEFEFVDYPYQERGIEILNDEKVIVQHDDYTEFLKIYGNLCHLRFCYGGESVYSRDEGWTPEGFFENGMFKDSVTKKYYILTYIDVCNDKQTSNCTPSFNGAPE